MEKNQQKATKSNKKAKRVENRKLHKTLIINKKTPNLVTG